MPDSDRGGALAYGQVQFGVVVALSLSARAHGLKNMLVPIAAALVPGLPTSFAVVLYFLLETRQTQGSSTLLPLRAARDPGEPAALERRID